MTRRVEVKETDVDKVKRFVRDYWPLAVTVAGAAGVVGAAVWMTARYLRESKKRDRLYDKALETVEKEVAATDSQSAVLLETGSYLGKISGEEGKQAIDDLGRNIETEKEKEAFAVLQEVIGMEKKK